MSATYNAEQPVSNTSSIETWNQVLTPKWLRFRHLLVNNGQVHSDIAYPKLAIRRGQRVLDVACGFGENTLELADRVGPLGSVLGIDCGQVFVEIAERERHAVGADNVAYQVADIETAALEESAFDAAVSRFGIMFCQSPVRAMRAIHRALVAGGEVGLIAWRRVTANPCWRLAEQIALRYLPRPGAGAQSCGPGPFALGDHDTIERIMQTSGFGAVAIERIDAELCVGRTLEEAIDYQMLVGPAGYVIREAGSGQDHTARVIRDELSRALEAYERADGSIWMASSTWFVRGRKAG